MRRDNRNKNKFLKIGSITVCFVFVMMAMAAFVTILPTVSAIGNPIYIVGDIPNDVNLNLYFYNASQDDGLDGVADPGETYFGGTGAVKGNTTWNDNDDYNFSTGLAGHNGPLWIYVESEKSIGNVALEFNVTVAAGNTYIIDIGEVFGTSLYSTGAPFTDKKVIVTNELGSGMLSSEDQTYTGTAYYQYYPIYADDIGTRKVTNDTAYVLFTTEATSTVTWNQTKFAGKRINLSSNDETYGVKVQWAPDSKVTRDLHTNLSGGRTEIYKTSNEINVGLCYDQSADGLNNSDNDQPIYYDNITSGTLNMGLYNQSTGGTVTTVTITPEAAGFTQQDATVKINGTVPYTDIGDYIREVKTVIGGKTYNTTPNATGHYTLYIPSNVGSITLQFAESAGGDSVFNKSLSIGAITAAGDQDKNVSLARLYGMTHPDLESGTHRYIKIYNDTAFSNEVSDSGRTIQPGDASLLTNWDYEIYYEVTYGNTSFYPKLNMDGSNYTTYCVAAPNSLVTISGGNTTLKNYNVTVNGTVPSDIDKVEIDLDKDGTNESYSTSFNSSGVYHIFTVNDTDDTSAVLFYNSTINGLVLNRTKNLNLTQSSVKFDVAKLSGSIKGTFTPDDITNATVVCDNKSTPTTILDDANDKVTNVSGNDTYYVYFEVTNNSVADGQGVLHDGYVDVKFTENTTNSNVTWRMGVDDNSSNSTFGGSESLEGGEELTIDLYNTMNGTVHLDINEIRLTDAANWNPVIAVSNGTGPENYTMYFDNLTASSGSWWYYAYNSSDDLQLKRNQSTSDASTLDNDVFNVGKLKGNVTANLNSTGTIEVTSNFAGTTNLSSETEHPNTDNTPNYNQYFEANSSNPTTTDYYINATMVGSSFSTAGNNFTINSTYLGWANLTVEKTGNVSSDIILVGIDKNKTGTLEDNDAYTTDFDANGTYHIFTTPDDNDVSILFNTSSGTVLNATETALGTAGTYYNNLSKVQGNVSADLNTSRVELRFTSAAWANGTGAYVNGTVDVSGSPNYMVYYEANGSLYYILFGKGVGTEVLEWSLTSDSNGNRTVWINVSKVEGNINNNFTNANNNGSVKVHPDRYNATLLSSVHNITTNGTSDGYEVYFVQSDTNQSISENAVDLNFTSWLSNVTWRYDVDDDPAVQDNDFLDGGDNVTLNMMNRITGTVHDDIADVNLTNTSWTPATAVASGGPPHNYSLYVDNITAGAAKWWLYAYNSSGVVLRRNKTFDYTDSLNATQFNVSKLSGNVSASLNSTGTIEVTSNFAGTTNLSSETENPDTGNDPNYNQYFEAESGVVMYYLNATMIGSNFSTAGNGFNISSNYLGWANLTVEKTGSAVAGITKIGIDKSKDGSIGPNNNDSYTVDFAANRTYHLFTTPGDADVSVLFFNASGTIVLNLTENLSAAGTHYNNISKLQGLVPSDLNGKVVEVETTLGQIWNNSANHSYAMVDTSSSPNYVVYFNDTASGTYYALFGKTGTTKLLERSFSISGNGNVTTWKNVSKVYGDTHSSLGTPTDVNDTFSVYNDSGLTKAVSSETNVSNTSLTPNYEVYYETTNGSASYYLNATANDGTGNYTSHVNFTCTDVNASDVYNIDDRLNGTVPNGASLIMSISIDNGSDGNWDSYTNSFNATGYYMLFINATGSANVSFYRAADMDSDVLLWGDKSFTNATFDVARINGSIHTTFSPGNTGIANVYTDWVDDSPTGQLNNVSFVTDGNEYEVFIDVTTPPANVDVNFTDENGYRSWAINVTDSTDNAINGSDQVAYNATTLIHGYTPLDSGDRIAVKNVTNTTLYAIGIPLTSNGTYRIYTANQSGSINFQVYNDTYTGGTLQLNRTSGNNLNSSETFNVGKVSGDVHSNLKTGDDLIEVYGDRACTATQLSSETENPTDAATPDYTQYFEADATTPTGTNYYINASMVDSSGNTYSAVGTVFTIPATMNKTMPLDRQLNGSIPADGISATDTDIGNVTLDINADYDYDVATTTVHFASTDCYYLWFNSSLGSAGDTVRFYNITGTTLLLNRTVDITDNNTLHVGKVMGEAHSYLEDDANDDVKVYDGIALANQLNSEIVRPQQDAVGEDYEVFYNQSTAAVTGAILKITDAPSNYISYHRFNWTQYNETVIQNLSALKYGNVTEEAHSYPLVDVSVKLLQSGGSYIYSNTTTFTNGTYKLFTSNGTYDVKFEKIGYVTQTNSSEVLNSTVDNPNNISMQYVVKLWVQDPFTNPPAVNATVTVIKSTGAPAPSSNELYRTKVNIYTNRSETDGTYYYYNISPALYPRIKIKVVSNDPIYIGPGTDDNASTNGPAYYSVSNASQQTATSPYELSPKSFGISVDTYNKTVKGGDQITFTVDNTGGYTGTQLNVSLDVSGLNASNTVYATDGDSDGRYTVTITVDNTTKGTKTVTATATNNNSVTTNAYIDDITIVGASIAIEPSSGGYSTTVYVNGSGFRPHELVVVDFGSTPDIAVCYATSTGIINTTFTVDVQPAGNTTVCARGSYTYNTTTFDITGNATITAVSPKYGPVGTDITVTGVGYGAYENVTIDFGATSTITYAYTDAGGGFTARFMVDAQTEGTKTIWANGTTTGESATESFEIRSASVIIVTPRWETGQDKIVSGSVTIEVDAPLHTYLVEFRITNDSGATWYNLAGTEGVNTTDSSAPWSQTWDTTMFDDAASCIINITAKAKDDTSYYVIGYASLAGITVDNTNPVITINSPTSSTDYRKAGDFVDVNFTYTEVNLKRWEIRIYNNTLGTIGYASDTSLPTSPATIPVLIYHASTSGYYNISVTLYDKVGNSKVSYSNNSVKVDSTLPTITNPTPTGITGDDTPWINATLADTGGSGIDTTSVRLTLDGTKVAATVTSTKVSYEVPSSLVNGTHTVSLYVADNASNWNLSVWSFTVDTNAPSVEITNPNTYDYVTGTITLRAAVSDTFSGVQNVSFWRNTTNLIGTDTNKSGGWTTVWNTAGQNGTITLTAKAYDNVDNTVTSAAITVYVDNAAPSVTVDTITSPTCGTIQINATTSDTDWDHVDFEYSTDNAAWYAIGSDYTSGAWSVYWDTTAVADGTTYYVNATATDNAGLNGTDTEGPFEIDNTAPVVNITPPTAGDVVNGTIAVTYTVIDENYGANTSSIDGNNTWNTAGSGSFNLDTTALVDGAHTVRVKSVDALGNTGYSTYVLFIVDNGAPEAVYVEYPAYSCYVAGNLTIKAVAADSVTNVSYIKFYNDTTLIGTDTNKSGGWSYTWNTSNTNDGYHNLSVIAYDQEGNSNTSPSVLIIVDNTAPTGASVVINSGDDYTNTRLVNLTLSATDDDSPIYVSLSNDNNNWTAWFSYIENMQWILPSGDGTKTVYFLASDIVDNYAAVESDTIILDTTAPVLTITSPTAGLTVAGSTVNVTFTGREYDVYISIDGAPYIDTNGADWHIWNTTAISNGTHTLKVKDNDTAGNNGYSEIVVVNVDNSKPYAHIWIPPSANATYENGIYVKGNVTIKVSAFDPFSPIKNVTFYNGTNIINITTTGPWNDTTTTWNVSGAVTGTDTIYAVVADMKNNTFTTSTISVYVNRDITPPKVRFVSPTNGSTQNGTLTVQINATDDISYSDSLTVKLWIPEGRRNAPRLWYSTTYNGATGYYEATINLSVYQNGTELTLGASANDSAGFSTLAVPVTFTVNSTTLFDCWLSTGWNEPTTLLPLPVVGINSYSGTTTLGTFMNNSLQGKYTTIYHYNVTSRSWTSYAPLGLSNDLTSITPFEKYYIYMATAGRFYII